MYDYGYDEKMTMNLRDSLEGVVKGQSKSGLYIDLKIENDVTGDKETVPVFGFWTARVPNGAKVICSIKRWAREDKDILVTVDSVEYEHDEMAA